MSGTITLASSGPNGLGNASSFNTSLSADGTKVAFDSAASNLVAGDTNGTRDVFVKDLATGTVTLASAGSDGLGNGFSSNPSLSADGTKVAFSSASILVDGDTNGSNDIFVKDLATGAITLASSGPNGEGNGYSYDSSLSADGTKVAFRSNASNLVPGDTNGRDDVFVKDLVTGAITLASAGLDGQGNGSSSSPSLSADGAKVAFDSAASNLVAGDTNGSEDVFVKNLSVPINMTTIGAGPDSLVLRVSQNAYQGSAQYTVSLDGNQVGGVLTASASRGSGSDVITVRANLTPGPHEVRLTFLNDAYGGTPATDRNLFLDGATYNGAAVPGAEAALYSAGPAIFGITDNTPPPSGSAVTVGAGPDALVLMLMLQQDAYQGDAQYTVSVDGAQVGGVLTASATRASGQSDTLTVRGDFAPGSHTASVAFLNDAWGGTPDTDRNLFVTGGTYNGATVPGAGLALYSSESMAFAFTDIVG